MNYVVIHQHQLKIEQKPLLACAFRMEIVHVLKPQQARKATQNTLSIILRILYGADTHRGV